MSYIITLPNGKKQINKVAAFHELLQGQLPDRYCFWSSFMEEWDREILRNHPGISSGALANAHGDWYEWLLTISAWNYHIANPDSLLALLLPKLSQFDVVSLYVSDLYNLVRDLREKVSNSASVRLITSNPDFVLIDNKRLKIQQDFREITVINQDTVRQLEEAYKKFINKCEFEDITGYIAAKLSLRSDRRLQIPHEGSLMKAIYAHLQTRKWIIQPRGLKYYAITSRLTDADKAALKTVATHSITTVFTVPQAAVDEVFEIDSLENCETIFGQILG